MINYPIYIYIHTYTHIYIHTYARARAHAHTHTHTDVCISCFRELNYVPRSRRAKQVGSNGNDIFIPEKLVRIESILSVL